jgi:ankyrin repeat protein
LTCGKIDAGAFFRAVRLGGFAKVSALLEDESDLVFERSERGETPLHDACDAIYVNAVDMVKLLLNAGAEVNAADENRRTPLFVASRWCNSDVVKLLLRAGANVNAADFDGETPLQHACANNHDANGDTVKLLLGAGAKVDGGSAAPRLLFPVCGYGRGDLLRLLVEAGANVNAADSAGYTPLWVAAKNGNAGTVKMLLEAGANVNPAPGPFVGRPGKWEDDYYSDHCSTPLWVAAERGHAEVVKLLLEAGAIVDVVPNGTPVTPLWIASKNGHAHVVKLLLEAGADVEARNRDGATPLWAARGHTNVAAGWHTDVMELLVEAAASPNVHRKRHRARGK